MEVKGSLEEKVSQMEARQRPVLTTAAAKLGDTQDLLLGGIVSRAPFLALELQQVPSPSTLSPSNYSSRRRIMARAITSSTPEQSWSVCSYMYGGNGLEFIALASVGTRWKREDEKIIPYTAG
jgi:hypothetical protein